MGRKKVCLPHSGHSQIWALGLVSSVTVALSKGDCDWPWAEHLFWTCPLLAGTRSWRLEASSTFLQGAIGAHLEWIHSAVRVALLPPGRLGPLGVTQQCSLSGVLMVMLWGQSVDLDANTSHTRECLWERGFNRYSLNKLRCVKNDTLDKTLNPVVIELLRGRVNLNSFVHFSIGLFDFCCHCWVVGVRYMFWILTPGVNDFQILFSSIL